MQACQYGHDWEVVQTLILFKANIHRADYINGGTALHLAALNGHSRCIRLLLTDYIPSIPNAWNILSKMLENESFVSEFDESAPHEIINKPDDGGITALHMAALNGHVETVQLLLDLGASVFEVTVEDGALFCVCSFTKRAGCAAHFVIESTPFQPIRERDIKRERWVLTEEGKTYAAARSPEVRVFLAGPPEGISLDELQRKMDPTVFKIGRSQAIKNQWVEMGKQLTRKSRYN